MSEEKVNKKLETCSLSAQRHAVGLSSPEEDSDISFVPNFDSVGVRNSCDSD